MGDEVVSSTFRSERGWSKPPPGMDGSNMASLKKAGTGRLRKPEAGQGGGNAHEEAAGTSGVISPGGVQWRLVLSAGLGTGVVVTILFYYLPVFVINHYAILLFLLGRDSLFGIDTQQSGILIGRYGMPALYLLLTVLAASWVARRVRATGPLHGVLTGVVSGLVSAVLSQAIRLYFFEGPADRIELIAYPLLAIGGGFVGGLRGWNVLAGQEVLYKASRDVSAARSSQSVAAAVGENLAGSEVTSVALWEATWTDGVQRDGTPQEFVLLGSWAPNSGSLPSPGTRLDTARVPKLDGLREGTSLALRAGELAAPERETLGVGDGSTLLLPLVSADGFWTGLLTVGSRKKRGFSRAARRAYLTVAVPIALALENLRLVEQARRAGLIGERQRLAHEIHDTLAQGFTSIVMNLEAAEAILPTDHSPHAHRHLDQARLTARESLAEARRLVWALRPKLLEEAPLPEALSRLAERWSEASGVAASVSITGTPSPLAPEVEVTLLRVAQEALANVRKHARAGRTALTLSYMNDLVALDARDDGAGFDPSTKSAGSVRDGGFGLETMHERVESLGGTLSVESIPGEGTSLAVELPLSRSSEKNPEDQKSGATGENSWNEGKSKGPL